jgi:peptide/nickel transport system permease protein
MLESVFNRDLPTIEAIALLSALIYVVCNLAADLVALALDPKLRTRQRRPRTRTRSTRKAAA